MSHVDFSLREMAPLAASSVHDHAYLLATRGYSIIPDFLSSEVVGAVKSAYLSHVAARTTSARDTDDAQGHHVQDLLAHDVRFARLLEDARLDQLLSPLLGAYWVLYAFTTSSIPPHGRNYGGRVHVDSPRLIPGYPTNIGVIWALDDFTIDNGATEVLPGSHHSSIAPTDALFESAHVGLTCRSGALIVFQARMFHRAGVNRTDAWRHSLTMNCCRPFMKQRLDWVRLVPSEIADSLNEMARRVLGFYTRVPTSMDEYNVPPEKRLYRGGQE
jgi:ectoine hydroxylase-related dioxygenase (phytanoyl-CoA dioxygenase family)